MLKGPEAEPTAGERNFQSDDRVESEPTMASGSRSTREMLKENPNFIKTISGLEAMRAGKRQFVSIRSGEVSESTIELAISREARRIAEVNLSQAEVKPVSVVGTDGNPERDLFIAVIAPTRFEGVFYVQQYPAGTEVILPKESGGEVEVNGTVGLPDSEYFFKERSTNT